MNVKFYHIKFSISNNYQIIMAMGWFENDFGTAEIGPKKSVWQFLPGWT